MVSGEARRSEGTALHYHVGVVGDSVVVSSDEPQRAFAYRQSFFFQAEDGIRDATVTGVQTCALPISDGLLVLELGAHLKLENEQPIGAFKIRGAYNAIRKLADGARQRGVITFSSGNHGQAVAYAAKDRKSVV